MNPSSCFHCGLPVPSFSSWSVLINNELQPMCCPGCQAVAQSIIEHGLGDYYATRTKFANTISEQELVPPELALYESAPTEKPNTDVQEECYTLQNIRCAACIWLIERRLKRLPGVISVSVNAVTERLYVRWETRHCNPAEIIATLRMIGYIAYPFNPDQHSEQLERHRKTMFRQLFVAGLSMMQVMMYALPIYLTSDGSMDYNSAQLLKWAALLLTLPAIVYSARPFFQGAWRDIKNRMLGMDVPVALGIAAAFFGSVVATIKVQGDVYFDSVTMFIFLLLCSRYLELTARRKAASALEKLQGSLPASAWRMRGFPYTQETELIPAAQLQMDDVILVKPGDAVPTDCVIISGISTLDLSLLTGESLPRPTSINEIVPGGAVNLSQPLVAQVTCLIEQSTLSVLIRLINQAGQSKPRLALWADRIAAWFVAALLLFAIGVFCWWHWFDPERAWPIAITVLVVSCPCALSLATPTALATATNRLLREKILVVRSHVMETWQRATHVVFDKTGTLTQGKPRLKQIVPLDSATPAECLHIAAAMEQSSNHPLAHAILEAARDINKTPIAFNVHHVPGQGVEASVDGILYRLGNRAFLEDLVPNSIIKAAIPTESTSVFLACANRLLARFAIADEIRPEATSVVNYFHEKKKNVILLSGDRQEMAEKVGNQLSITTVMGDCLPEQKLAFVQSLQREGNIVAMVGDGINDAAVLRAADVSFAMGSGAALAQTNADCVLLSGQLSALCESEKVAQKTIAVIRQNLAWAVFYNMVAIPAAAFGLINPWISGIGMSLSSMVVVLNALRLR